MHHAAQVCFGLGKPPDQDPFSSSHGGMEACGGEPPPPPSARQGAGPLDPPSERSVTKTVSREGSGARRQREGDEPTELQQPQQQPQQLTWEGSNRKPQSHELEQPLGILPLAGDLVHTSVGLTPSAAHFILLDGYVEMQELLGQGSVRSHLCGVSLYGCCCWGRAR